MRNGRKKSVVLSPEKAAMKIQAVFRGYLIRKNVVYSVRKEFENLLLEIEKCDTNLDVYWRSSALCYPKFIGGEKRVRIKEEVELIPYEEIDESITDLESDISFELVERKKVAQSSDDDL